MIHQLLDSEVDGACAKSLVLLQKFRIFTLTKMFLGAHNSEPENCKLLSG